MFHPRFVRLIPASGPRGVHDESLFAQQTGAIKNAASPPPAAPVLPGVTVEAHSRGAARPRVTVTGGGDTACRRC